MKRIRSARTMLLITASTATVAVGFLLGPSNIDPAHQYSWSENTGWMNWRDANGGTDGVVVNTDHLSGYIWGENAGWINVGDGGGPYTNTNGTDFGVNIGGGGNLSGYGWGENIGWINFDTSGNAPNQARYDSGAGRFFGYAWGENVGWINLDDATHYVAAESAPFSPPVGDPNDVGAPGKVRFISFSGAGDWAGETTAIRVTLTSLQHPAPSNLPQYPPPNFGAYEGLYRWLGEPVATVEMPVPLSYFTAAPLVCESAAAWRDWSEAGLMASGMPQGLVHVYGEEIVPSSSYDVQVIDQGCGNTTDPACYSATLTITTARWGDVTNPYQDPGSGLSQPDFFDVSAVIDKWKNTNPAAAITARAELDAGMVNLTLNFFDISAVIDAWSSLAYPYGIATNCP